METDSTTPIQPDTHRFLVDLMLGTLVAYLRVCGYDTVFVGNLDIETDMEITRISHDEHRVLITRDAALATQTKHSLLIESQTIDGQLGELHDHGVLLEPTTTAQRCGNCNARLEPATNNKGAPDYVPTCPPEGLWHCPQCNQYFWQGSHWETMENTIRSATEQPD